MILGLNGPTGSGKDTFAKVLCEEYGFTRFGFADAVRDAVLATNPIIATHWQSDPESIIDLEMKEIRLSDIVASYGWEKAKREVGEVRRLLQVMGTQVGRQIMGENCWVDIVKEKIFDVPDAIITDLRFPNEADFVKEYFGKIIRIVRPNNPLEIKTNHVSEQYVPKADLIVYNHGSLEQFEQQARNIGEDVYV